MNLDIIPAWIMRFEASKGILQLLFLAITAGSTMVSALVNVGLGQYIIPAFLIGFGGVIVFSWVYVEKKVYNEKNRILQEKGRNFVKPQNVIDDVMIARAIQSADKNRELTDDERQIIYDEMMEAYMEFSNGIKVE